MRCTLRTTITTTKPSNTKYNQSKRSPTSLRIAAWSAKSAKNKGSRAATTCNANNANTSSSALSATKPGKARKQENCAVAPNCHRSPISNTTPTKAYKRVPRTSPKPSKSPINSNPTLPCTAPTKSCAPAPSPPTNPNPLRRTKTTSYMNTHSRDASAMRKKLRIKTAQFRNNRMHNANKM